LGGDEGLLEVGTPPPQVLLKAHTLPNRVDCVWMGMVWGVMGWDGIG
jgi:hypothetical protein